MNVLMITGDKQFTPGHERYDLQKSAVDVLQVVYWGRGSMWPALPKGQFDVVTAQDPLLRGLFGLYVGKKIAARVNIQVHMDLEALSMWKRALAKFVLRNADTIRVVSEKIKSQVERLGVRATIAVVPVFVDVSRFIKVERVEHVGKNILWIGRLEPEKNPLLAIQVFKEVLKVEPTARLQVLGEGSLRSKMSELAAQLPINAVELKGWQDPVAYLGSADVVLSTSVHESWGASIVEALAAGVPVVAPDVGIAKQAGAHVAKRADLAKEVVQVLQSGQRGDLHITLLSKEAWATQWRHTL